MFKEDKEMKLKVTKKVEVEITALKVDAGVRYWEDANVNGVADTDGNLMPCVYGERWKPIIDVENGKIINWMQGNKADIHYKVCDDGNYFLVDKDGVVHLSIEDGYVPSCLCPKGDGYGDYIILTVDEDGIIEDWDSDFEDFFNDED